VRDRVPEGRIFPEWYRVPAGMFFTKGIPDARMVLLPARVHDRARQQGYHYGYAVLRLSLDLSSELEILQPTTPGRGFSEYTRDPSTSLRTGPTTLRTKSRDCHLERRERSLTRGWCYCLRGSMIEPGNRDTTTGTRFFTPFRMTTKPGHRGSWTELPTNSGPCKKHWAFGRQDDTRKVVPAALRELASLGIKEGRVTLASRQ
jgi:hypothetical protein